MQVLALRYLVVLLLQSQSLILASMSDLDSDTTSIPHNSATYTFQIQDSGYTEPGCGEPGRIEAAKQWARDLDDPTQITAVNIVTYMVPHISYTDDKERSEALISIRWDRVAKTQEDGGERYLMHAKMDVYTGRFRNHLDRIFEKMIENVNEEVRSSNDLTPSAQLEALFEQWRGSYMYLD